MRPTSRDAWAWRDHVTIDWDAPWLAPYRASGEPTWRRVKAGDRVHEALEAAREAQGFGRPPSSFSAAVVERDEDTAWRFVAFDSSSDSTGIDAPPPSGLDANGEPALSYEERVHRLRAIPTRDNLHDFFNGLVWLTHPVLKARLNAWHVHALRQQRGSMQGPDVERSASAHSRRTATSRGALRDALTLFDEDGVVLRVDADVARELRERAWLKALHTQRHAWLPEHRERDEQPPACVIVGHALLEKLCTAPRKSLTGHALDVDPLALSADDWASKPCFPLPVLGVPGWCAANEDASYYADEAVFRLKRALPLQQLERSSG